MYDYVMEKCCLWQEKDSPAVKRMVGLCQDKGEYGKRNIHLMVKGKGSDWDGSSGVKGFT